MTRWVCRDWSAQKTKLNWHTFLDCRKEGGNRWEDEEEWQISIFKEGSNTHSEKLNFKPTVIYSESSLFLVQEKPIDAFSIGSAAAASSAKFSRLPLDSLIGFVLQSVPVKWSSISPPPLILLLWTASFRWLEVSKGRLIALIIRQVCAFSFSPSISA